MMGSTRVVLTGLLLLSVLVNPSLGSGQNQHIVDKLNSISRAIKREVKDEIFTETEGSFSSHTQAEREAMPLEVEPLPPTTTESTNSELEESTTDGTTMSSTSIPASSTTTPSPYTYTVTGGSVTPTLPYEGSPTPSPYVSPLSFSHSPATAYPVTGVTYPHPPIPTYPPSVPIFNQHTTMAPIYIPQTSSLPRRPSPTPFTLVEDPLPSVHHPPRKAQFGDQPVSPTLPPFVPPKTHTLTPQGFSAASNPQPFLSQVHPTPFSFQPLPQAPLDPPQASIGPPQASLDPQQAPVGPPQQTALPFSSVQSAPFISDSKPAITFEDDPPVQVDVEEIPTVEENEAEHMEKEQKDDKKEQEDDKIQNSIKEAEDLNNVVSRSFPNQEARRPKQFIEEPSPQPIFGDQGAPGLGQQVDQAIQQLQLLQFKPGRQSVGAQQVQSVTQQQFLSQAQQQFPSQAVASQQFSAQVGTPQQFSQQASSFPTSGQAFQQLPSQSVQPFLGSSQAAQQQFPSSQQLPQQLLQANPALTPQQPSQPSQFAQQFGQPAQAAQPQPSQFTQQFGQQSQAGQPSQFSQQFSQQSQLPQQLSKSGPGFPNQLSQFPTIQPAVAEEVPQERFISRPSPQQPEVPQQQTVSQQATLAGANFDIQPAVPQPIPQAAPQPALQAVPQSFSPPASKPVEQTFPETILQVAGQVQTETPPRRFIPQPSVDTRAQTQQVQSQQFVQPQQPEVRLEPVQQQIQPQEQTIQGQQFQAQVPVTQNQQQGSFTAFRSQQFEPQLQQVAQQAQAFQAEPEQQRFPTEQPTQQLQPQLAEQFQPQGFPTERPTQQFQPQQLAEQFEPQAQLDQSSALFNSINKPATDREPRRQLKDLSQMHHLSRVDALAKLMDIAGSDWDLSVSIQENLVDGGKETDYVCPTPDGHFPDVDNCGVYFQCSGGVANKQKCPAGLKYNVLTNQCDWEASVNCDLNRDPRMLNQHAGPSPRPQPSPQNKPFTALQPLQSPIPFNTFFRF